MSMKTGCTFIIFVCQPPADMWRHDTACGRASGCLWRQLPGLGAKPACQTFLALPLCACLVRLSASAALSLSLAHYLALPCPATKAPCLDALAVLVLESMPYLESSMSCLHSTIMPHLVKSSPSCLATLEILALTFHTSTMPWCHCAHHGFDNSLLPPYSVAY
ncbi:hypothetical protein HAX54_036247 [Datura stramonium]|uniref:Uncharacterized protein n=1 Tax=Datura stramonium TaxID=4076 RepID=A0ABS8SFX0_DATST|nr:hypothetical protein [Datura stramonium]